MTKRGGQDTGRGRRREDRTSVIGTAKLQARDRAQLVVLAYESGLVTPAT